MSRIQLRALAIVAVLASSACAGLKDAMTAHVDLVARAGSQELSATRLAQMMNAAGVPPRKDIASAVANLWLNYQLLGVASAHGDTLADPKVIDDAMWAQIAQLRSKKFYEGVQKNFTHPDPSTYEKRYNDGELLAARHILFMAPATLKPAQVDSVRRVAEGVRKQVTVANFPQMAQRYGQDGTKAQGGDLGVFEKGRMVPDFEKAVLTLKPGEIAPQLVQTQFGFHIIERESWAEAKAKFTSRFDTVATTAAESTYLGAMEKNANVEVKPGAAKIVKAIAEDVDSYRNDNSTIATSKSGNLTAARLARWMAAFPPQARIREQISQAPDSAMPYFVRNVMRNELVLHAADSAKIVVDSQELAGIRGAFARAVTTTMTGLQIAPAQLADSAKAEPERERLAAARIEAYLDKLLKNQAPFIDVSEPVALALRKKYDGRIVPAGIDRALAEATKLKARDDSAKAKALPPTAVPMPGGAPAAPAPAPDAGKAAPAPTKTP